MKALIFDFGNVVGFFDHHKACRELASLSESSIGENVVYQELFATSLERDFDCGRISSREFIERLRISLDLKSSNEEIVKAWCDIFWPNDVVISLLPRLKKSGVRMLLASNTNELHFQWILRQFAEPLTCFDDFVLSYRIGSRKPALPFFHTCLESAGVPPEACVYIDDRPEFVEVARGVGMTGIVYNAEVSLSDTLSAKGLKIA